MSQENVEVVRAGYEAWELGGLRGARETMLRTGAETPLTTHSGARYARPMARGLAIGGAAGLAVGIVVSVLTDVPFAPEIGLLLGLLIGWGFTRRTGMRASR